MDCESVFWMLYEASVERTVDDIVAEEPSLKDPHNWVPYGQNESNFGVVENQQASPVPALVEKLINSIDAILTRECLERRFDPTSAAAPRSIEGAVEEFFPEASNWDLPTSRRNQAERIQIIADGPRMETSLTIYDDGEGQHPEDFEKTFLSLLRGNKNEIHFVQGKYNMGGAGAITFCGQKRYQLIGSRRWDGTGDFGFTLIRRHPLNEVEKESKRATWYEYFLVDGAIPSFPINTLDLGLRNRRFSVGTVVKLYSYDLPVGTRSVISRDLNQSLNEYLFSPALPLYTIDRAARYPKDRNLQRDLYGLKHRLELDDRKYLDELFSEELTDAEIGRAKVYVYVFSARVDERGPKETRETIRREFFKNGMSVLFSVSGQVHGHYTSEFITRALKYHILKDHLLIHVDCTSMELNFRNELFMASRDRLKGGKEARQLRQRLSELLSTGRLKEVYKERKAAISVESTDTDELFRNLSKNLPLRDDLMRLLEHTMAFDRKPGERRVQRDGSSQRGRSKSNRPGLSNRFPSFMRLQKRPSDDGALILEIPKNGSRTVRLDTDVENQYFDRINEPGDLTMAILDHSRVARDNPAPRLPSRIGAIFNVVKSSPQNGTIRVVMKPTKEVAVGDSIRVRARLSSPAGDFDDIFMVKITDPEKKITPVPKKEMLPDRQSGLPEYALVYKDGQDGKLTWEKLGVSGIEMDYRVVMYPAIDEKDLLEKIYINMDSQAFLGYRSKLATLEQIELAEKRYISAVYFHGVFLYSITKNGKYSLKREKTEQEDEEVTIGEYLGDLFRSHYAEFLLNFEVQELMEALG